MSSLTASVLSLKGTRYGQEPRFTLLERARAAFGQGIAAVGAELGDEFCPEVFDYAHVDELEWVDLDKPLDAATLRQVTAAFTRTGANRINVGSCGTTPVPLDVIAGRIATLADEIYPAAVAVEPVAFGWLGHVDAVLDVISRAGRLNAGLLLDFWQVTQDADWTSPCGNPVPVPMIAEVQVCGTAEPLMTGTVEDVFVASQDRPHIADSEVDAADWLRSLRQQGYTGPVSFEMPYAENYTLPLDAIAANLATEMNAVLLAAQERRVA